MDFDDCEHLVFNRRQLLLSLNGVADAQILTMDYTQRSILMSDIKRKAESDYNIVLDQIRLFTSQGVEIYEEDLPFLKDQQHLYVSDAREFDSVSQFSLYEIIKTLGEGGFGKVMLGKHKLSNQLVAIKIIESLKHCNASEVDQVFREAEIMKTLKHKNIVTIHNCYTLPNLEVILIMEYLQGGDLLEYIQSKGRLPEEEARTIFKQIAEGIAYCHSKKLVHRDLKLENVLLTSKTSKDIKIIDFGISGVVTNTNFETMDSGTLSYMPPEIFTNQGYAVRPSYDVWSLGVMLYAMVIGKLPFEGNRQDQIIRNIITANYVYPNKFGISKDLQELINKMLTIDPVNRIDIYSLLCQTWINKKQNSISITQAAQFLSPKHVTRGQGIRFTMNSIQQQGLNRNLTSQGFKNQSILSSGATVLRQNILNKLILQENQNNQAKIQQQSTQTDAPSLFINAFDPVSNRSMTPEITLRSKEATLISPKNRLEPSNIKKKCDTMAAKQSNDKEFNQQLVNTIFREDAKNEKMYQQQLREKVRRLKQITQSSQQLPVKSQSNTNLQSGYFVTSKDSHRSRIDTKKSANRSLKLAIVQCLSQHVKSPSACLSKPSTSSVYSKRPNTQQNSPFESLYQIQRNFAHRKQGQDKLQLKTFTSSGVSNLKLSNIYNVLFSKNQ